jgi:glycosyltransferase involved in cell wall biosynthesis
MYNAEKYIAECLDSLLEQTFQDFEVIVVDDCSTDKSVEIVKSYEEKFDGRLLLTKMEKNSGSGGLPRNKGMTLSRGEYIQFLDADDMLTNTALEEMYTLAKEYNADVVYCEKHYKKDDDGIKIRIFQQEPLVNKPVLETNDLNERVDSILNSRFVESTCFKFVQRKLLLDNEIFFPHICPSEDDIWTYGLVFHAKRLLRVPNAIYIRRISRNSIMRKDRNAEAEVNFWLNPALLGSKALDKLMSGIEFFQKNPQRRYAIINKFINGKLNLSFRNATPLFPSDIYSAIKEKFGEELGKYDVLISALCATLYSVKVPLPLNNENSTSYLDAAILRRFGNYITAKLFVQMHKKMEPENLQIVFVSDSRAKISKPAAWQKFGNCYMIDSYFGQLEIVAKANDDGQVRVLLAGPWALNPKDKTKKLPYWIDYTKLIVNDKLIFNKVTPAWHDKNYIHVIDAKAGDEITIKVEWLPHRSDT